MLLRIRLKTGPRIRRREYDVTRRVALGLAALLTPAALVSAVLACWRLAADMEWAGDFPISDGPFSHWQMWFVIAGALEAGAVKLGWWGKRAARG